MLGKRTNQVTSIAFAMLILTSMAAPAIAASNDDGGFLAGVSESNSDSRLDQVTNLANTVPDFVSGLLDRVSYLTSKQNPFADDENTTTAASEARDVQKYFNSHNQSFVSYVNNRSAGGDAYDVWKLTIKQDDQQETLYLVATYNNSSNEYETAEMVNSTSRTVDETVTLEGYAAKNAREELEYFYSNYVTEDKPVDSDYKRRLAGKYAGYVESSILEDEGDS